MKSIKTPKHPALTPRSMSSRTVQFLVILRTQAIYVYLFIYEHNQYFSNSSFLELRARFGILTRKINVIVFDLSGKNGLRIEVVLGRRLLGNALTIFLPTMLLLVIGEYKLQQKQRN